MQTSTQESVTLVLENFFDRQTVRRALELYVASSESNAEQEALANQAIAAIDTYPST